MTGQSDRRSIYARPTFVAVEAAAGRGPFTGLGRGRLRPGGMRRLHAEPLAADAPWAEGTGVGAELFERPGQGLDVGVGEVAREVLFDPVPVVAASPLHRTAALVRQDNEDRAAVVLGTDALDEASFFHSVNDAGEAALAVQDPLGELIHAQPVGSLLEVNEGVVPAQRDPRIALELRVEHVNERERALEVEAPGAQPLD